MSEGPTPSPPSHVNPVVPDMTIRKSTLAAGLAGLIATACLFGQSAVAQRQVPPRTGQPVRFQKDDKKDAESSVIYYGVNSCNNKGCHGGDAPATWIKDEKGEQMPLLVRCDEAKIVEKSDKHGDAYKVLEGNIGKVMEKNLRESPYGKEYQKKHDRVYAVTEDPNCLACHAVVIKDAKVKAASERIGYTIKDGVGCAACHGADSRWVANHALMVTAVKFRPLSRKEKEEKYGLIDLRDPVRRTELCASCHVGSMGDEKKGEHKKFVTHEMYAAGHPPLPGFEVATFSNEEPRHWRLSRERDESILKELGLPRDRQEETHFVLLGGAIAFRDTMRLLQAQATDEETKEQGLDLANYDCYSCHHDVRKNDWRRHEDWVKENKPGKARVRDWSFQLIRLTARYLDGKGGGPVAAEVDAGLKTLSEAIFTGNLGKIATESKKMDDLADKLAKRVEVKYPKHDDLRPLLDAIPELYGKGRMLNYDSAREVAWAAEVIRNEYDPKNKANAANLAPIMNLRLPQGRGGSVEKYLDDFMKKVDAYNPITFRELLTKEWGFKAP